MDTDTEKHLNPIYGYIWNTYSVVENYYNFFNTKNYVSFLISKSFHKANNDSNLKPNIKLLPIKSEQWGSL